MFKVCGALIAGGVAAAMLLQSALIVAAAPQHSSSANRARMLSTSANTSAPSGHAPTSLGHFFGKATSNLAHIVPAGPTHGKVISSFARSSNPSHTNGHRGHGAALGKSKN